MHNDIQSTPHEQESLQGMRTWNTNEHTIPGHCMVPYHRAVLAMIKLVETARTSRPKISPFPWHPNDRMARLPILFVAKKLRGTHCNHCKPCRIFQCYEQTGFSTHFTNCRIRLPRNVLKTIQAEFSIVSVMFLVSIVQDESCPTSLKSCIMMQDNCRIFPPQMNASQDGHIP